MRPFLFIMACLAAAWFLLAARGEADPAVESSRHQHTHWRRPVAAAWLEPGHICIVANSRSGTLSRVDVAKRAVVAEQIVAGRLADLVRLGDSRRFLLLDDKTHELIVVSFDASGQVVFDGRTRVSHYPIRVVVSPDGAEAAVAGLWSRCIDVVALRPRDSTEPAEVWNAAFPRVLATIPLSFNPRAISFVADGEQLVVADAFGGQLAAIDWHKRKVVAVHRFDGHNLQGLAVDAECRTVTIVGQHLDSRLPTTIENLQSGALLQNQLWRVAYEPLVNSSPLAARDVEVVTLDHRQQGAGDPSSAVLTLSGEALVSLGGAAQLAVVGEDGAIRNRYNVGTQPVGVLPMPDESLAIVVNRLDDSLSLINLQTGRVESISLGSSPEPYPRDRGEILFFDASLSTGGRMSCPSCHTDGHTNGLTADTLGDGDYGNPKRVIGLRGTALTDPWAWNGVERELRDQVRRSFETTMSAAEMRPERHDDVVAFLHTLPFPPPPLPGPRDSADDSLLKQGSTLFEKWRCGSCHIGPLTYTSQGTYDVGLRDERGLAKFNPPSLRGVGQGSGFFHDNRAATLDEVLQVYRHQVPDDATDSELIAVLRFLRSL